MSNIKFEKCNDKEINDKCEVISKMADEIAELRSMLKVVVDDVDCYGELTDYNFKKAKDMLARNK